ncbi:hypothetical protein ABBQ38_013103 [Trebouxia sp. C0009 RCD-2024]
MGLDIAGAECRQALGIKAHIPGKQVDEGFIQAESSESSSGYSDKDWIREMHPPPARRDSLPPPKQKDDNSSIWSIMWSILKESLGKDLTHITLPFFFNEPLSVLQKSMEDLEYADLLNKAASKPPQSLERMLYVAAFAVSSYSGTNNRFLKPFNPLLGETFEFEYPEQNWRGLAEKVVHHPTIVAMHGEGESWSYEADADVRAKFWGRSVELVPVGLIRLRFDDGDEYQWAKVTSSLHILGKPHIEHSGIMKIDNLQSTLIARIKFEASSRLSWGESHQVSGEFVRGKEKLPCTLAGAWDKEVHVNMPDGSKRKLWQTYPMPKAESRQAVPAPPMSFTDITHMISKHMCVTIAAQYYKLGPMLLNKTYGKAFF